MADQTVSKQSVTLSNSKVTFDKVQNAATVLQAVMERRIVEQINGTSAFVSFEDAPTSEGWYKIDRVNRQLIKVNDSESGKLSWNERLYVVKDVLDAVAEKRPLMLGGCDGNNACNIRGLILYGRYRPSVERPVVQVRLDCKPNNETQDSSSRNSMLRKQ